MAGTLTYLPASPESVDDLVFLPLTTGGAAGGGNFASGITNTKALSGTGSVVLPIFRIVGAIWIHSLWGEVTIALGNHTAASWRLNDQSATTAITAAVGTTLTNFGAGSLLIKRTVAGTALSASDGVTNPSLIDGATAGRMEQWSSGIIFSKAGVNTDIEYLFGTTDNPAIGTIKFYLGYKALDSTTTVTAL